MAYYSLKLVIAMQIVILAMFVSSRPTPLDQERPTLFERLKLDNKEGEEGGSSACWDSMFELKSCSGEVILFFLNGETYLGPSCCSAIRTIEHHCWPAMLGTLGYTSQEEDVLRGYCDDSQPGNGTTITPHQPIPTSPPPKSSNVTTTTPANPKGYYLLA